MEKKTKLITLIALIIGVLLVAVAAWWLWWREPPFPEGLVQANGRFEGDHYTVSGKWPGRVVELLAREGDLIQKGQVMVKLDDAQTLAKVNQAKSAVDVKKAELKAAQTSLSVFKKNVPLKIDTAKAELSHANAELASSFATEEQMLRDAERFRELLKRETVERRRSEQADLSWKVARAQHHTAQSARTRAEKQLAEARLGQNQIKAEEDNVNALSAKVTLAEAALAEEQSVLNDLVIRAPATGMITTRIVDNGEMVAAGSPLYDIVDLDKLYLKVYVPEKEIGKVRLGLPAQIYTDAFPDKPFPATIRYIASQAEFTPKEVQTPDERVKLVYAVKLYLNDNPGHKLTPGLPADAVIRWQEDTPWAKPRW
ncbi:MAG: efflux RND transporter periplasmic adaptor subunit [Methylococcales bacterium]|nr:efflux RND transporter periplasmic adaptor subunit [Methylococcales bacterium]MDD5632616.1 efflux RND transporter periplasmic adaptor subunit [Methylococcales bacterium]